MIGCFEMVGTEALLKVVANVRNIPLASAPTEEVLPMLFTRMILRSQYRRSACSSASRNDVQDKVTRSVAAQKPIAFSVPFGGYKSWRVPGYPLPDWAEVFAVLYLIEYALPIAAIYQAGVEFTFSYCSIGVPEGNNLGKNDIADYVCSFQRIIDACISLSPLTNITIRLLDIADLYSGTDGATELENNISAVRDAWNGSISQQDKRRLIDSARRNLRVLETDLPVEEFNERCEASAQVIYSVDALSQRRWYNKFSDRIQLVQVKGPEPSIHIGSCRSSICQCNVGMGVIEFREKECVPRIISTPQLEAGELIHELSIASILPQMAGINDNLKLIPIFRF